jgi:hypothetical protein
LDRYTLEATSNLPVSVVPVEVPLVLAAEGVRHGRATVLAAQQTPKQRAVLVANLRAAGSPVELELLLDLVEQLLVDDRLVFAGVKLILVAHLAGVRRVTYAVRRRRAHFR